MKIEYKRTPKKTMIIAILFTVVLLGANLFVSNILATTGERLTQLTQRKDNLITQNNQLRSQILSLGSLELIYNKAVNQGFQNTQEILSLFPQESVAMNKP